MLITKFYNLTDKELLDFAVEYSSEIDEKKDIETKLLHWDFGPIMEMKLDVNAKNYLFSSEHVPFHWDGAFYKEPKKLLFYCTKANGKGGETIFVNTTKIWNSLKDETKEILSRITLTYKTDKLSHYGGMFTCPMIQKHPETGETIIRLAEKVESELNPVSLSFSGVEEDEFERVYSLLVEKFYSPEFIYEHNWQVGDLIICDNFTYLHGRRSIQNNLARTFKRIQIL